MPPRNSQPQAPPATMPVSAWAKEAAPKLLDKMKANPKGDWSINDIQAICDKVGLTCSSPSRGSHYKVSSQYIMGGLQVIPARRPIKPPYIKSFLGLVEAHLAARTQEETDG